MRVQDIMVRDVRQHRLVQASIRATQASYGRLASRTKNRIGVNQVASMLLDTSPNELPESKRPRPLGLIHTLRLHAFRSRWEEG